MRVVGADELTARAGASGTRWGATGDDEAWRETVRAHLAAEGSVLRRALVDRVLRWHDAPDDDATRGRVNDLIDALDGVGDVLVGDGGLVGAAPLRAALVGRSRVVLLLGSVPTAVLAAAMPEETIARGRVRRVLLRRLGHAEVARAMDSLGGSVIDARVWAGLDRAPPTLDAWWQTLGARRVEAMWPSEGARERAVFVVHNGRGRWRRPEDGGASLPQIERERQPGGWYRYAWRTADGACPLTSDEATRTMLAVEARAGVAREVIAASTPGDVVTVSVPGWVPRAEYRFLLGVGDRLETREGNSRYAVPSESWAELAEMFSKRLGMIVDESGVMA